MSWVVHCADVLAWCEDYAARIERGEAEPFHASLGDWPYELSFMGKRWDATGVSFQPETWEAVAKVLYPGGFILAFGGSRTYHRLAVAAEDAGLIIHPALVWLNGQGFPKATRIDTQIDKAAGVEREVVGLTQDISHIERGDKNYNGRMLGSDSTFTEKKPHPITAPATPLAATWAGHRYGLQALKPCAEFILVAQKPYEGRPVDSITSTGAGALNIDQSRVATGDTLTGSGSPPLKFGGTNGRPFHETAEPRGCNQHTNGRWPPNVLLSHVPPRPDGAGGWLPGCERLGVKRVRGSYLDHECSQSAQKTFGQAIDHHGQGYAAPDGTEATDAWACVLACGCGHEWTAEQRGPCPACGGEARWLCAVGELGEQSGERRNGGQNKTSGHLIDGAVFNPTTSGFQRQPTAYATDAGTAARFFPQFSWSYEAADRLAQVPLYRYVSKASRAERDAGLEGMQAKPMRYGDGRGNSHEIFNQEGCGRNTDNKPVRNPHPTVKPIELTRWLATLILPPPEYAPRRIIIPFGGVMSEAIGAGLAGWDEIEAIEKEEEYIPIGEARLAHWLKQIRMELAL